MKIFIKYKKIVFMYLNVIIYGMYLNVIDNVIIFTIYDKLFICIRILFFFILFIEINSTFKVLTLLFNVLLNKCFLKYIC